ncbi:hypothetical protein [Sinorhizobium psoraleae]|uniref:Uncharacterized protein n=1 Tax=Sinorhizobium psoraleae TaxID=520838 RepID=A0ABT4K9T3_9HYPH|nr:hypothetical protein [Sinorhizobium psoraleae]MCZ4088716.1 hypothetical protein [Sinorhizobium psoraleae]
MNHLELAGKIASGALEPRFLNVSDFNFNPQRDSVALERQKREWGVAIAEPSKLRVSDYLISNPGSDYSTAAWKYIDDHQNDPDDASGSSLTSAEAIDSSFPEGQRSGKLIAIATSGFNVNFPRNTIGFPKPSTKVIDESIVYADRSAEIADVYASRYETKGSKLKFDIDLIDALGAIAVNTGQISRSFPSGSAEPAITFNKSASVQIGGTIFDEPSGTLYAEIGPGQTETELGSGTWAGFDYRGDQQPSFNILNRALSEVVIDEDSLLGASPNTSIASVTAEVRKNKQRNPVGVRCC